MPHRPRIGVIGVGRIAADYLRVIPEIETVELVAVADLDETARAEAADRVDVPVFGSAHEMLSEADVDAALVLTPPATHEALTLDLLAHGITVCAEFTLDEAHCAGEFLP